MNNLANGPNGEDETFDFVQRLQAELDETSNIKREAEAVNDPDLVAECAAAETRLKVSQFESNLSHNQPSLPVAAHSQPVAAHDAQAVPDRAEKQDYDGHELMTACWVLDRVWWSN